MRNTGGRALDLDGSLTLRAGPAGWPRARSPATVPTTLAPGQSGDVVVPLDRALPAGPWTARLTLTSGRLSRAVEASITFPEARGTAGAGVRPVAVAPVRDRRVVLPVAAGVLLAVGGAVTAVALRRRRAVRLPG